MTIDFDEFRKTYKITSAEARAIIKQLGYEVVRRGTNQFIEGMNQHNVSDEYFLKHALVEYRRTMRVDNTIIGNFFDANLETKRGKSRITLEQIDADLIEPIYKTQIHTPNKKAETLLVKKNAVVGITNQSAPKAAEEITAITPEPSQAIVKALAEALVKAQQATAAPDPLAPQKALQQAAENRYLLTAEQLGQLLGMSKNTISSKKSGFRKLGYEYEKVKEGSSTLWKVAQY